jgi:hypothetical protein
LVGEVKGRQRWWVFICLWSDVRTELGPRGSKFTFDYVNKVREISNEGGSGRI